MKKYIVTILAAFALFACESSQNYSVQVANQKKKIKEYITKHNLNILSSYPKDSVFKPTDYLWENEDSIVFHLTQKGNGREVKVGDIVQVRWVQYTLDGKDSVSYWTTSDLSFPLEIMYNPNGVAERNNLNCIGWQNAIGKMKHSGAIADIIIPSPIGLLHAFNSVTAYRYKFTFLVLPK